MAQPQTKPTGEIVPRAEPKPADQMIELVQKMVPQISVALPKHMTGERMARIVATAIRATPSLATCSQMSFIGCVLSCAQLGLEPNTPLGLAYLIPRKNNKKGGRLECTLLLGYQGMLELGSRAGVTVFGYVVREGDDFKVKLGSNPEIEHVPSIAADRQSKAITHAYAVSVTADGRRQFTVLTKPELDARRARSSSPDEGPWATDYEAMCLKSAVRAHFRWMPKATEHLARGIAIEESAETGQPLLAAMDPAIADALEREGLVEPEATAN